MTTAENSANVRPAQPSFRESLARARQQQLPVIRLLSAVTGDQQEAADLALKAFVRAARRKAAEEAVSTTELLREVIRLIDAAERERQLRPTRSREPDPPEFDLPDGEIPEPFGTPAESPQEQLMASLAPLPRLQRDIFLLDRAAGLPADQIARVCGVSVKRIRRELEEMPAVPPELLRGCSPVSPPWYFDAVLLQNLAGPRTRRTVPRWLVPIVLAIVGAAAASVLLTPARVVPDDTQNRERLEPGTLDSSVVMAKPPPAPSSALPQGPEVRPRETAMPVISASTGPSGRSDYTPESTVDSVEQIPGDRGSPDVPGEPPADTSRVRMSAIERQPERSYETRQETSPDSISIPLPVTPPSVPPLRDSGRIIRPTGDSSGTGPPQQ